jgi:hypothetical protein
MSALLVNALWLKPEIRLVQAILQFEADFSSEHKVAFHIYRSQLYNSSPNYNNIMRLAAKINYYMSGKISGRQYFGPRLINILEAI